MVAAADGLAAEEATWLRARTLLLGLTPAQANQLMQYDTSFQNLEPVLKKLREGSSATGLIGRYIFYDGSHYGRTRWHLTRRARACG